MCFDDVAGRNSGAVFLFTDYGNDCNGTGTIDTYDLAEGTSTDLNANGIPDECDGYTIPTASSWGLVVMCLLLLLAGTVAIIHSSRRAGYNNE